MPRQLNPSEQALIINLRIITAWSDRKAISFLDEFHFDKAEVGLELMWAGMMPDDVVNTLRLDTQGQLLIPAVRQVVLAGYSRLSEGTVKGLAGNLNEFS